MLELEESKNKMKNIYEGLAMTDIDLIPKETPAFNGDYLKISVEKGYISFDEIII